LRSQYIHKKLTNVQKKVTSLIKNMNIRMRNKKIICLSVAEPLKETKVPAEHNNTKVPAELENDLPSRFLKIKDGLPSS